MSDIVIQAENLGKKYMIGHQAEVGGYLALRDVVMQNARGLWHKTKDLAQGKPIIQGDTLEEIWALRDVSFEIRRGEAVGIIGRNGAGKSTLLKILSRITEPSAGRVTIQGRVASLLEVGTGFHPELTGRENIYLNGAILGMTRAEVKRKFDEIIAFAEVEKFLDTPVKRYSSGMYVRLAFAVAAHLEPEILLVDEVLAVGDVAFQRKCLGKMHDVAGQGRTVLFVSHNMAAISTLCDRLLVLKHGMVGYDGWTQPGIQYYLSQAELTQSSGDMRERIDTLPSDPAFRVTDFVISQDGGNGSTFVTTKPVRILVAYEVLQRLDGLRVGFDLKDGATGLTVFRTFHDDAAKRPGATPSGHYVSTATIPANYLAPLEYVVELAVGVHAVRWINYQQVKAILQIVNVDGVNAGYGDPRPGVVMPRIDWATTVVCPPFGSLQIAREVS